MSAGPCSVASRSWPSASGRPLRPRSGSGPASRWIASPWARRRCPSWRPPRRTRPCWVLLDEAHWLDAVGGGGRSPRPGLHGVCPAPGTRPRGGGGRPHDPGRGRAGADRLLREAPRRGARAGCGPGARPGWRRGASPGARPRSATAPRGDAMSGPGPERARRSAPRRAGGLPGAGGAHQGGRRRAPAGGAREGARLSAERLRPLPRPAHGAGPRAGRTRAVSVRCPPGAMRPSSTRASARRWR